mgnify:CR=1 FL=1
MRAFFLLLVFANLAFFAYGRVALEGAGPESRIPQLQVAAERIRLINTMNPAFWSAKGIRAAPNSIGGLPARYDPMHARMNAL